jgi:hypothetical protein
LRVQVYAGLDPVTKKRYYLMETIPSGPKAAAAAEKARTRLLAEVDQRRAPRTRATVNELMDRYLERLDVEPTTRERYGAVSESTSARSSAPWTSADSTATSSTASSQPSAAAAPTAMAEAALSNTEPLAHTPATTAVGRTSASRWPTARSARSTASSTTHATAPSAGSGSV